MKLKWKIVIGVVIGVAALLFIIIQFMRGEEVEVKEVSHGSIKRSFTEDGTIKSPDDRNIYPLTGAKIEKVNVEKGKEVEKGDLLVVLNHSELGYQRQELDARLKGLEGEKKQLYEDPGEAELESIKLNIERAKEDREFALKNLERIESLYESNYLSEQEFERAKKTLEEAEHFLKTQKNSKEALKEAYEPAAGSEEIIAAREDAIQSQKEFIDYQKRNYYHIFAPISGVVTNIEAKEGDMATPEAFLMNIFRDDDFKIETNLLTRDIFEVSEGMEVNLTLELRGEDIDFKGEVSNISSRAEKGHSPLGIEEERVEVTIDPEIPEDLTVGPGFKLDVEFVTEKREDELIIPATAVFSREGKDAVLIVEENRSRIREVTTGFETRNEVVIREGLEEGDKVIIDPRAEDIKEGARVRGITID